MALHIFHCIPSYFWPISKKILKSKKANKNKLV